jgi:DNA-binding CsgD family transcriptional regulator
VVLTDERIDGVIGRIYGAALEPRCWPRVLVDIADFTGSIGTNLILQDKRHPGRTRVVGARLDQGAIDLFLSRYIGAPDNLWTATTLKLHPGVVRMSELVPPDQFTRTAFYDEVERPQKILHHMCAVLENDASRCDRLGVFRTPEAGPGEPEHVRFMALVAPHVRRAVAVAERLDEARLGAAVALDAIAALSHGVFAVDVTGRVVLANAAAEAILAADDGLLCEDGVLGTLLSNESTSLAAAIGSAITGRGGGRLRVTRRSAALPYLVLVAPTGGEVAWSLAEPPAALVFVTELAPNCATAAELAATLFALTPAEARLAAEVAAGCGMPEAARRLGVALPTVRTQLASIFRKTGTRSQPALVALLTRLAAL